jgi:tryptophan-rich sensory protein
MNFNKTSRFLISIIICEFAGVIGSVFTAPEIGGWYKSLQKPSFNPPSWIFAPVWTLLFLLMGISFYLVWEKKWIVKNKIGTNKKAWNSLSQEFYNGKFEKLNIILIFWLQLFLNVLWSVAFFGMNSPSTAFSVLLMLWISIVFTIINFYRVSKISAYLLIPYILWVSFAGILNFAILILN